MKTDGFRRSAQELYCMGRNLRSSFFAELVQIEKDTQIPNINHSFLSS